MQIEIRNIHESYEFDLYDYLIFVGSNQSSKHRIFRLVDRYFASTVYNELEEEYFGTNGIEIFIEGKKVKGNSCMFMSLSSLEDILLQLKLTKKSLLYCSLCELSQDIEVCQQMMHINNELLKLESLIADKQASISENIDYQISELNFEETIAKLMTVSYKKNNRGIPGYLLNGEDIIDGYLSLIEQYAITTGKQIWISINNPENFLSVERLNRLILGLKELARISKQVYFFISHQKVNGLYHMEDIHHTVVCASDIQQLPDFETFQKSIERNYPGNCYYTPDELVGSFYRISSKIGMRKFREYSSMNKDLVLLKVMSELFQEDIQVEMKGSELSLFERAYLLK